jgi:cobalt-zinc-cadmium efflux system outer membrane protein
MNQIFPSMPARATAALPALLLALLLAPAPAPAQQALTWDQVKSKFEVTNPTLKADSLNVDEMKAQEISAFLRPNPQFTLSEDGTQIAPHNGVWTPFRGTDLQPNVSYLHERDGKRELRLKVAQEGTKIAESQHADLDRTLLFTLRSAFIQTLQAKTVVKMAKEDLEYYDHIIQISRDRYNAGDIAADRPRPHRVIARPI